MHCDITHVICSHETNMQNHRSGIDTTILQTTSCGTTGLFEGKLN
jgi:hypothetical protein